MDRPAEERYFAELVTEDGERRTVLGMRSSGEREALDDYVSKDLQQRLTQGRMKGWRLVSTSSVTRRGKDYYATILFWDTAPRRDAGADMRR